MNNITYTQEQKIEFYKNVPDDIQEVLLDDNFGPAIQVIGRENGLTPTQSLEAEDVVTLILLGIEPLSQFNQLLQEKLELPREKVQEITKSIDKNIFLSIKESLEKVQSRENSTGAEIIIPYTKTDTSKTIKEDTFVSIKNPAVPTTNKVSVPTPPLEIPVPVKPITGAEKIGINIPKKENGEEHPFEKKLRAVTQLRKEEIPISIENKAGVVIQKETQIGQKKIDPLDPYKETAE